MKNKQKQVQGKCIKNFILNKEGSTLVTVLVAVAFIVILASIVLSTSIVNYRMKGIDRKTKTDFYSAEKALNDIYTGLGQDVTKIAAIEYSNAFARLNKPENGGTNIIDTQDKADKEYRKNFYIALTVPDSTTGSGHEYPFLMDCNGVTTAPYHPGQYFVERLASYIVTPATGWSVVPDTAPGPGAALTKCFVYEGTDVRFIVEWDNVPTSSAIIQPEDKDGLIQPSDPAVYPGAMALPGGYGNFNPNNNCLRLEGVKITSIDKTGYQSMISTDILIATPSMDFFGNNVDFSDFALVANQGILFNGQGTSVAGNIYGGIEDYDKLDQGGLKFADNLTTPVTLNGDFIVSRGNIIVGSDTNVKIGNDLEYKPNIWFESLVTKSGGSDSSIIVGESDDYSTSGLTTRANMFALNDLELDADDSKVVVHGSYYGYNNNTLAGAEHEARAASGVSVDNSRSSAIIINGNGCTLDMEDLDTFVLMGKAYLDFNVNPAGADVVSVDEISTGEGVALKSNQQLYLMPAEFLLDASNPCSGTFSSTMINVPHIDNWFGKQFVEKGDGSMGYQTVEFRKHDPTDPGNPAKDYVYTYVFLDFNNRVWKYDKATNGVTLEGTSPAIEVGTNGYISSQDAYRMQILNATAGDSASAKTLEPTALTLRSKAQKTMMNSDYYNLKSAVVANGSGTNIFSKNTVVQYKPNPDPLHYGESDQTVVENNNSLGRFAAYPQNLFYRYQELCCYLNTNGDTPLANTISVPASLATDWAGIVGGASSNKLPIAHLIDMATAFPATVIDSDNYETSDTTKVFLGGMYGKTLFGTGDITLSTDFQGVAIIDGNVTISDNVKVNGLIMATGKINIGQNVVINSDAALIQKRIDKEIELVKAGEGYSEHFLINYLNNPTAGGKLYDVTASEDYQQDENRVEFDYNKFMYFENWEKGEE